MARYNSFGRLDSPQAQDGDMAFVRWVSRMNPEQLQQGDVAYSQNGRMDNDRAWQPRKGIRVFSPALDFDVTLNHPFSYDDATPPEYNDEWINGVYGAGYFTDPVTGAGYLLIVTNSKAIAVNINEPDGVFYYYQPDGTSVYYQPDGISLYLVPNSSEIAFPADTFISGPVEVLQALDKVFIFRAGQNALWFDGDMSGDKEFAEVADVPTAVTVDATPSNAVALDGVVTVTETAHGRSTGDILTVYDGDGSGISEGDRYEITVNSVDEYEFHAEIANGTYSLTLGGKQPISGGYIAMPDPGWAVFHEGRLIVPYQRTLTTGVSRDEILFSDIFDTDTYDPILNQLRFASGSADSVIGVSPLLNDRLVVFCRRSVHLVQGVSGSLSDMVQTEVTREVGCIARKSIVEVGGTIMFLSDQGIYSLTYGQELNLIANAVPLSEPIENYVRQINWEFADGAIGAYADNRYFLAVPLGKSEVNNAMFVYNFLNQGWESVDTYPDGFDIQEALVVPYRGRNRIFLMNSVGAVHLTEEQNGMDTYAQDAANTSSIPVAGKLITRRYTMGDMDLKRFTRATTLVESRGTLSTTELPDSYKFTDTGDAGGTLVISVAMKDPDTEDPRYVPLETVAIAPDEDYAVKSSIRKRGYGAQIAFETDTAKVRGCKIEATMSSLANVNRS